MASIRPGTVIAGKYRIERPLSRGGMGSVWAATHLQLETLVAVKLMAPHLAETADGRSRFEREAKSVALIKSPHVVQVHDYGVEDGTPYMVMELLAGEDLGARLRRVGRLPLAAVAAIFGPVGKAMRRAHESGVVHRDLKPANIFLARSDDDEIVKVLDFGVAKMMGAGNADEATATGIVLGSVHYMSPEQARGVRELDPRSDLWSLGVIAYRALVGQLPFPGTQMGDVILKICSDPIPRPSLLAPDLGPEVDRFFARALERDPERRFQTARELSAELVALAGMEVERSTGPWAPPGAELQPSAELQPAASAPIGADPPSGASAGTLTGAPRVSDLQKGGPARGGGGALTWALIAAGAAMATVAVVVLLQIGSRKSHTEAAGAEIEPRASASGPEPRPSGSETATATPTPTATETATATATAMETATAIPSGNGNGNGNGGVPVASARAKAPVVKKKINSTLGF